MDEAPVEGHFKVDWLERVVEESGLEGGMYEHRCEKLSLRDE